MTWIISKALMKDYENSRSLRGPGAAYSADISSDGEQSAPSKSSHTPQAFLSPDKMTAFSRLSRYGMTFAPLTEDLGADLLTWFRAGFPARILAHPEQVAALPRNALAYGAKCGESLARLCLDSFSWKTHQFLLLGGLEMFSETWPRWGIMLDGECWELEVAADQWNASAFGLPAPTKSMGKRGWGVSNVKPRYSAELEANARLFGYKPHPSLLEWSMGWIPTWTRLAPLGTDKFQQWRNSHGRF
jgi:hypothetical protein